MARVMGITLPAGWDIIYNKTLRMYDISIACNVGKNPVFFPRKRFVALNEITYLFSIAYAWSALSDDKKDEWNMASNVIGQHSYNLYVQDKSYRIKNGIAGNAEPSLYHQFLVGHLEVQAPASSAKIVQYNTRRIIFPCSFELCFHTDLTADGPDPYCRLNFIWTRYYTGQNIENVETIEMPLSSGWDKQKQFVTSLKGVKGRWRAELVLNDVVGNLWFDNVIVEYSAQIRLNDPYCLDVVKWWKGEDVGEGVTFETVYPVGVAI